MSCGGGGVTPEELERRDVSFWAVESAPGRHRLDVLVPDAKCGACIGAIERAVAALQGVETARLNLTTRRLGVEWTGDLDPARILDAVSRLGYHPAPASPGGADAAHDAEGAMLLRALGVSGFAAMNVMLLSVSVWAGADGSTRDLFHWLSALIALPAILYAVRPFARSAWGALRHGRTNMDVPITLAVLLAALASLHETAKGREHAYFDASVMLLFFLLLGRTLDHWMRCRARSAASQLLAQSARAVTVIGADGRTHYRPVEEVAAGELVRVAAGEWIALDGTIEGGSSELDRSIATGESAAVPAGPGDAVLSGTVNLGAPLTIRVTAPASDGFLARMVRMMEEAEGARGRFVPIADRAARLYAPVVHALAALAFLGWWLAGAGWHEAMMIAVATLIITCPCALGLAVPAVATVASDMLFRRGILLKEGAALERLASVRTVAFDKTGTLTLGRPRLVGAPDPDHLALAGALARQSRHPLARAVAAAAPRDGPDLRDVTEIAGHGMEGALRRAGHVVPVRLGRPGWAGAAAAGPDDATPLVLSVDGDTLATFHLRDEPRPGARRAVAGLYAMGLVPRVVSGDRERVVAASAERLGIGDWRAECLPDGKVAAVGAWRDAGGVLMVGDGLNDGPALRAADVGMAPAEASDLGRASADIVFLREGLEAVPRAVSIARTAMRHVRQNLVLSILYNAIAVPLAACGLVTPLVAALAMSGSSVIVIANSLRLRLHDPDRAFGTGPRRPSVRATTIAAARASTVSA